MKCSDGEKKYVVNDEFNFMASCLIEKYAEKFHSINTQNICCVNLITSKKSCTERLWKLQRVKMPVALHCKYNWYVTFRSADWDDCTEEKKMCMVGEVLVCLKDFPTT